VRYAPVPRMPGAVRWASAAGGTLAMAVLAWVVAAGRLELAVRPSSDFFDAQARAWLDGRWDLPFEVLRIEAFAIDGKAYTYFGAVPAALRLPALLLGDALGYTADGRLAQPFMLVALALTMVGVAMLWWRVRCVVRGDAAVTTVELVLAAATVTLTGTATVLVFLAGQGTVYHEAILWGVAFALLSFAQQVRFAATGAMRPLVLAGLFALLALLSRPSVGGGPVAALAALTAVWTVAAVAGRAGWSWRQRPIDDWLAALAPGLRQTGYPTTVGIHESWSGRSGSRRRRSLWLVAAALAGATVVPVVAYAMVNTARFGEPFRLPVEAQVLAEYDPARAKALADNDNNLFGLRFVPTTAWTYLRPDAVSFSRLAPWVLLPPEPTTVIGDATFDARIESTSVTVAMPLMALLAAVGVVTLVTFDRRLLARGLALAPDEREPDGGDSEPVPPGETVPVALVGAVRLPVLGSLAGAAGLFVAGFTANRYLGDTVPVLVLAGVVGLHRVVGAATRREAGQPRPRWVVPVLVGAVVLAGWGVVANVAMAVEYQRLMVPRDAAMRYDFLRFQHQLDGHRAALRTVDLVPADGGRRGELVVVGECRALLWSDGRGWWVVEGELAEGDVAPGRTQENFFDNRVTADPGEPRPPELCDLLVR
jgi:hypothetical protein